MKFVDPFLKKSICIYKYIYIYVLVFCSMSYTIWKSFINFSLKKLQIRLDLCRGLDFSDF